MSEHPEDAMTRERVLDADLLLRQIACHEISLPDTFNLAKNYVAKYPTALASVQQEPAPSTHSEDAMTRERVRVRHVKRGSTYRIISKAQVQCPRGDPLTDYEIVVVYQSERDGEMWVRRVSEFEDGRFEKLPALASAQQEPARAADATGRLYRLERYADIEDFIKGED